MILSLIALFLVDLATGSVAIPLGQVLHILAGASSEKASWEKIVWLFRLPKAITAVLAGAGLAVSGLLMQNLFRNPLAGPSVLGVNAGAGLGVALVVLWGNPSASSQRFIEGLWPSGRVILLTAAGLGAAAVLGLILMLARKVSDVMTLLIIGILCGFVVNAAVSVLIHFSTAERIQAYMSWTFGTFAAVTWDDLLLLVPAILTGLVGCLLIRKPLNGLLLGETYARSMGVPINPLRLTIIALTALLAGSITAFCGPVAFIGMAVPHMSRMLLGSADHRRLLPVTALLGALTALCADVLTQLPGSQTVLPLNAVTALLGAPVIVWLIVSRKSLTKTFGA